jgi:hypothetical protein
MAYEADTELAMILPIPIYKTNGVPFESDAVRFYNLEHCPDFFKRLDDCFPVERLESLARGSSRLLMSLKIYDVGSFEASVAKNMTQLDLLDPRFKLDASVMASLPDKYKDYGFVVAKLKPGKKEIHPLAFDFQTRRMNVLFFPTVHVHDGVVTEYADFDHMLYAQTSRAFDLATIEDSMKEESHETPDLPDVFGLVNTTRPIRRVKIQGSRVNEDFIVD